LIILPLEMNTRALTNHEYGSLVEVAPPSTVWSEPHRPVLREVSIADAANVYPKMAFGRPITDMEPISQPMGMEGT
jgi:hypothetical protein